MNFKIGDKVKFNPKSGSYGAQIGATAVVTRLDSGYLYVNWFRNELSGEQMDGGYEYEDFKKIGKTNPNSKIIVRV